MRTTLDIDSDVLNAAKEMAERERTTAGRVISRLVREAISGTRKKNEGKFIYKNGVPVLAHREGDVITLEHVQRLIEEEGL